MNLPSTTQTSALGCTYFTKKSIDEYFKNEMNNETKRLRADKGLMNSVNTPNFYVQYGYRVYIYGQEKIYESVAANWIVSEMQKNHVVQVFWNIKSAVRLDDDAFHASLIRSVERHVKKLASRLTLMDPAGHSEHITDFPLIYTIFIVWK